MAGRLMKMTCIVLVCMALVGTPMVEGAISCGQLTSSLMPCLTYMQRGGAPSPGCCKGLKSLVSSAQTTADRQAACYCLKNAAGAIGSFNTQIAESLPSKCGVSIPYKISTSINCASIKF